VIVIDANLLIYSYDVNSAEHHESRAWLEAVLSGTEAVGVPWQCICAFIRVVTNRGLAGLRVPLKDAISVVEDWLQSSNVRILFPGDQHWSVFQRTAIEGQASGVLVSDAEIAALTIEYGGILHTADRDFARFPTLRWVNPLKL
jgi:hypothetical protein